MKKPGERSIAIIGMSCRFPGAERLRDFWGLLRSGKDAITDIPTSREGMHGYLATTSATRGRSNSRQGGFIGDIDAFDYSLFGISRRDALSMDPQQRILLELAWMALEDAGIPTSSLRGSCTGVFAGVCYNDYNDIQLQNPRDFDVYRMVGGTRSMLCGRISHLLGLSGPSLTVDAACASSLVAVHLALASLRSGESELALVAGVNLLLHPLISIGFSQANMLSPDSRCKAFADRADGFVRSDGAGLIVLKPLERALLDGDRIYAVLRGSGVSSDGGSDGPLMTPSVQGQALALRAAYADAEIDPAAVSYVEAHGTGTPVGDPVEAQALGAVLSSGRRTDCKIGSVKTNIGHTEAAAGMAALIKTALCLHERTLVPSLHCDLPNRNIPWQALRLVVQRATESWSSQDGPRTAGVSSFGLNGTNAHVVLTESPAAQPQVHVSENATSSACAKLLTISAHTSEALSALMLAYREQLLERESGQSVDLAGFCAAAALRRSHLGQRLAVVVKDKQDAAAKLLSLASGQETALASCGQVALTPLPLVFLYSGQGSQWAGMARRLYAVSETFRAAISRCDAAFVRCGSAAIGARLFAEPAQEPVEIHVIQPALFAIQVAVTAVFEQLGLVPDIVVGHSMGEVAAAYVAGALDLTDAARIICLRSQLLRSKSGQGAMAVLDLSLREAEQLLVDSGFADRVSVAVSSSAKSTVIAGEPVAVRSVVDRLLAREVLARLIQVDVASHSPQMDDLRQRLLEGLAGIVPRPLAKTMISTVTGQRLMGPELVAEYWVRNLRQPVLLAPVLDSVLRAAESSLVEISPHPLLLTAVQQAQHEHQRQQPALAALRKQEDDWECLLNTVGALHSRGHRVALERLFPQGAPAVSLPPYPFQREPCIDETAPKTLLTTETALSGAADPCLGTPLYLAAVTSTRIWQIDRDHGLLRSFADHRVLGDVVVPGAATVAWALAAAQRAGLRDYAVEDAVFSQILFVPSSHDLKIQVVLSDQQANTKRLQVFSALATGGATASWQLHAEAALRPARLTRKAQFLNIEALRSGLHTKRESATIYRTLARMGLDYGDGYQWLAHADIGEGDALAEIAATKVARAALDVAWAGPSPPLLDACLQVLVLAALGQSGTSDRSGKESGYLPVSIEAVRVRGDLKEGRFFYAQTRPADSDSSQDAASGRVTGDVWLLSQTGEVLMEVAGASAQALQQTRAQVDEWQLRFRPHALNRSQQQSHTLQSGIATGSGYYLLIGGEDRLVAQLAERLLAVGSRCICVQPGPRFHRKAADHFEVAVTVGADWQRLEQQLAADSAGPCAGVVYLLGLDARVGHDSSISEFGHAVDAGCVGLLSWLQAHSQRVAANLGAGKNRVLVVTRAARAVVACEPTQPLQAMLWGFSGVIASEHPELQVQRIDVDSTTAKTPSAMAAVLYEELASNDPEHTIAWRGSVRYAARLTPCSPDEPALVPAVAVRGDATYVVTGGLSGLGLQVAGWLAAQGAKRLLLLGRRAPATEAEQTLELIRQQGAEVIVALVDITDADALQTVLKQSTSTAFPLRGIIHSAAVLEDNILLTLQPEQLLRVLAPKVLGALQLEQLTRTTELDFFVVFSSVAAVLSNPGQSSYCAANAFLDSLAEARLASGKCALSIAWGPWAATGLAARGQLGDRLSARGLKSLQPDDGLQALARLLLSGSSTCCPVVANLDVERWLETANIRDEALFCEARVTKAGAVQPLKEPSTLPAVPKNSATPDSLRAELQALSGASRQQRLTAVLQDFVAKILRTTASQRGQLALELPLTRLGLDSLMAVELRNRIDAELGVRVPLSLVMQNGTIGLISERVLQELPAAIEVSAQSEVWEEGEL